MGAIDQAYAKDGALYIMSDKDEDIPLDAPLGGFREERVCIFAWMRSGNTKAKGYCEFPLCCDSKRGAPLDAHHLA